MCRAKKKILVVLIFALLFVSGCTSTKTAANTEKTIEFKDWIIEKVKENYDEGDMEELGLDIAIDQIYYGSFSQKDANEMLVLCKILNVPHAGGLDQTVSLILSEDSFEVVAYRRFSADEVVIKCLSASDGRKRILFLGTTTYQGLSTQELKLYAVEGNEWIAMEAVGLENPEEFFWFVEEELLIAASNQELTDPEDIIEIYHWDSDKEKFLSW